MEFKVDLDGRIIVEVEKHPILYNVEHENYTNIAEKDQVWKEIGDSVCLDEFHCKKRWKTLRDSYKRCKKLHDERALSGIDPPNPKRQWKYFNAMSFLDNYTTKKTKDISLSRVETSMPCEPIKYEIDIEEEDFENSQFSSKCSNSSVAAPTPNINKVSQFDKFLEQASVALQDTCSAFMGARVEQNSTHILLASLATKIQNSKLPPALITRIEGKIACLVFEEIEKFQNDNDLRF